MANPLLRVIIDVNSYCELFANLYRLRRTQQYACA